MHTHGCLMHTSVLHRAILVRCPDKLGLQLPALR